MGFNGSGLLVMVNTGTEETPAYEVLPSQRDATIEEADAGIDVSSKDSRAQRVLPGRYSSTLSVDKLYVPNDDVYAVLRDALRAGTLVGVAKEESDVVTETAAARVDSLSESYPDQGESLVSISMTIDGFWEPIGS